MILSTQVGKGNKMNIYGDGEFLFAVDCDTWYSLSYSDGDELTAEEYDNIKNTANNRLAYAQALRFLTLRAHSSHELFLKLTKNHSKECANFAIERCRELGFIDDGDFALRYAQELYNKKKYGKSRIIAELKKKGIGTELIDTALDSLDFNADLSILDIIEKKYSSCLNDEKGRRRMIAGLTRLGYSYSEIKSAISQIADTEDDYYEY